MLAVQRATVPPPETDIIEDVGFQPDVIGLIDRIDIYLRPKEKCPFNRGNWCIDICFNAGGILCVKLPKEMTREQVHKFCEPLKDKIVDKVLS